MLSDVRFTRLDELAADPVESARIFQELRVGLANVSDRLTQIYFSHAVLT
jgi:hypothetical protein